MPSRRAHRLVALAAALAALTGTAACGRSDSPKADAPATRADGTVDAARCTGTTTGVTSDTITFGLSNPQSGPSASAGKSRDGIQAYFAYANAELGGVKGHKLRLVAKDDAAQSARTVTNVNDMLDKDKVFGFVQNLGTPNNLAVWNRLDKQCVPNLLVANGSPSLVDPVNHPFTLIANVPYADEVKAFVDYLVANHPGAKIASITENSDFGKSYRDPLAKAVRGTSVSVVSQQTYEQSDPNVVPQMTAIKASGATALFIGAAALKCPQSIDAAAKSFDVVYLSANCTSKATVGLAKPQFSDGVITESARLDPLDPTAASNPRLETYFAKMKQYAPGSDARNGSVLYGWDQATILRQILEASPALDRVAVINTARHLTLDSPGLAQDGIVWKTDGIADPYPVESFRLQKYDGKAGHFVSMGTLVSYEGRSGQFR
jgi:branched-chain amino acid transport system substrate-binding protein